MEFSKDGVLRRAGRQERTMSGGGKDSGARIGSGRRAGVLCGLLVCSLWGSLWGLFGCSASPREISVSDYSKSCTKSDECVVIFVGDICKCQCRYGAISQSSYSAYQLDRAAIKCDAVCGPCPTGPKAVCDPLTRTCGLE